MRMDSIKKKMQSLATETGNAQVETNMKMIMCWSGRNLFLNRFLKTVSQFVGHYWSLFLATEHCILTMQTAMMMMMVMMMMVMMMRL